MHRPVSAVASPNLITTESEAFGRDVGGGSIRSRRRARQQTAMAQMINEALHQCEWPRKLFCAPKCCRNATFPAAHAGQCDGMKYSDKENSVFQICHVGKGGPQTAEKK